jgi:hypothetical protein
MNILGRLALQPLRIEPVQIDAAGHRGNRALAGAIFNLKP